MVEDEPRGSEGSGGAGSAWQNPWLKLSVVAAALVGVFALKEAVFWKPPLSFTIGTSSESGVLRDWEDAPEDAPLPIHFSDGTLVELQPNARARVVGVGRAGADVVIESGRAQVDVAPAHFRVPGESPWRLSLGPFSVEAMGTRFDVEWDPRSDNFELDLHEGSVTVSGCERDRSITVVAGQGVRASCSRKQWTVLPLAELAASESPAPSAPPPNSPGSPASPRR